MTELSEADPDLKVREAATPRSRRPRRWLAAPLAAAVALWAVSFGGDRGTAERRLEGGPLPPPVSIGSTEVAPIPGPELTVVRDGTDDSVSISATSPAPAYVSATTLGTEGAGPTPSPTSTTTTTTSAPSTTVAPPTVISVGLTAPDPDVVDAMLGSNSAPEAVAAALLLSPDTQWIANTRIARIFLNRGPNLWQVGDGSSLVVTRDEAWQGRLARSIAEDLVAQGFWYGDTQARITDPVFHAETGIADVRVGGTGQVAVGPDALVYVMTPAEWQAIPPVVVPPLLAGLWRLPEVEALGFVASDDWWTEWNIVGLGATEVSSTFVGPASLDQRRVLAALCGAGAPITTIVWGSDDDGPSTTYLSCERDGTAWNIGVEILGPEMRPVAVLRLAVSGGDAWPYVGATGPDP